MSDYDYERMSEEFAYQQQKSTENFLNDCGKAFFWLAVIIVFLHLL